jgi:hypothetical protein
MAVTLLAIKQLCEETKKQLSDLKDVLSDESWHTVQRIEAVLPKDLGLQLLNEEIAQQLVDIIVKRWAWYQNHPLDYTVTKNYPITQFYFELAKLLHKSKTVTHYKNYYQILMPTLQVFSHFDPNLLSDDSEKPITRLKHLNFGQFILTQDGTDFIDLEKCLARYFQIKSQLHPALYQLRTTNYADPNIKEEGFNFDVVERFNKATSLSYYECFQRELTQEEIQRANDSHTYNGGISGKQDIITLENLKNIFDYHLYPEHLVVPRTIKEALTIFSNLLRRASVYVNGEETVAHTSIFLAQEFWMKFSEALEQYDKSLFDKLMDMRIIKNRAQSEERVRFSQWVENSFYIKLSTSEREEAKNRGKKWTLPVRYCAGRSSDDLAFLLVNLSADWVNIKLDTVTFQKLMDIPVGEGYEGYQKLKTEKKFLLPKQYKKRPEDFLQELLTEWISSVTQNKAKSAPIDLSVEQKAEIYNTLNHEVLDDLLVAWKKHYPQPANEKELKEKVLKEVGTYSFFKVEAAMFLHLVAQQKEFNDLVQYREKCESTLLLEKEIFSNYLLEFKYHLDQKGLSFASILIEKMIGKMLERSKTEFKEINDMYFITAEQFEQLKDVKAYYDDRSATSYDGYRRFLVNLNEIAGYKSARVASYETINELLLFVQKRTRNPNALELVKVLDDILAQKTIPVIEERATKKRKIA